MNKITKVVVLFTIVIAVVIAQEEKKKIAKDPKSPIETLSAIKKDDTTAKKIDSTASARLFVNPGPHNISPFGTGIQTAASLGLVPQGKTSGCRRWCRNHKGNLFCCEHDTEPEGPVGEKTLGKCPPVRPVCPSSTRALGPPKTCSNDFKCPGIEKCCFDICAELTVCKKPINLPINNIGTLGSSIDLHNHGHSTLIPESGHSSSFNSALGNQGRPTFNSGFGQQSNINSGRPSLNNGFGQQIGFGQQTSFNSGRPNLNLGFGHSGRPNLNSGFGHSGRPNLNSGFGHSGRPNLNSGLGHSGRPNLNSGFGHSGRPNLNSGFEHSGRPNSNSGFGHSGRPNLNSGFGHSGRPNLNSGFGQQTDFNSGRPFFNSGRPNSNSAFGQQSFLNSDRPNLNSGFGPQGNFNSGFGQQGLNPSLGFTSGIGNQGQRPGFNGQLNSFGQSNIGTQFARSTT